MPSFRRRGAYCWGTPATASALPKTWGLSVAVPAVVAWRPGVGRVDARCILCPRTGFSSSPGRWILSSHVLLMPYAMLLCLLGVSYSWRHTPWVSDQVQWGQGPWIFWRIFCLRWEPAAVGRNFCSPGVFSDFFPCCCFTPLASSSLIMSSRE